MTHPSEIWPAVLGGWAIDVVSRFPFASVVGRDIDLTMIASARTQAQVREADRAVVRQADILSHLDFENGSCDFITNTDVSSYLTGRSW